MSSSSLSHIYRVDPIPENHIDVLAKDPNPPKEISTPSYGVDSPLGLASSLAFSPVYLYATLKGKFDVWNDAIDKAAQEVDISEPCLDVGCGRGMVLIMIAERKKTLASRGHAPAPVFGLDIFDSLDQSGNSAIATYQNVQAADVTAHTVLHMGSFTDMPFADNSFAFVTSSLAIHNPTKKSDRRMAIRECARVVKPGGLLLIIDLKGSVGSYEEWLRDQGWTDISRNWAGPKMIFGLLWCEVLHARKPLA